MRFTYLMVVIAGALAVLGCTPPPISVLARQGTTLQIRHLLEHDGSLYHIAAVYSIASLDRRLSDSTVHEITIELTNGAAFSQSGASVREQGVLIFLDRHLFVIPFDSISTIRVYPSSIVTDFLDKSATTVPSVSALVLMSELLSGSLSGDSWHRIAIGALAGVGLGAVATTINREQEVIAILPASAPQ